MPIPSTILPLSLGLQRQNVMGRWVLTDVVVVGGELPAEAPRSAVRGHAHGERLAVVHREPSFSPLAWDYKGRM
jgi:hypothetical protein